MTPTDAASPPIAADAPDQAADAATLIRSLSTRARATLDTLDDAAAAGDALGVHAAALVLGADAVRVQAAAIRWHP
jgi:hypothetical protein